MLGKLMNIGSGALMHADWSPFGDRFVCVCVCGGDQSLFDYLKGGCGPAVQMMARSFVTFR